MQRVVDSFFKIQSSALYFGYGKGWEKWNGALRKPNGKEALLVLK